MIALAWFAAGTLVGIVISVIAAVIILNLPPPKREHAPVIYSANACPGRTMTSNRYGRFPGDFEGAVWSPPGSQRRN
jgi:hypothetical protein